MSPVFPTTLNELVAWVGAGTIVRAVLHRCGCQVAVTLHREDAHHVMVIPPYLSELQSRGLIPAGIAGELAQLGLVSACPTL